MLNSISLKASECSSFLCNISSLCTAMFFIECQAPDTWYIALLLWDWVWYWYKSIRVAWYMIQSCVELDIASRIVAFIKWKMCYWFVAKSNKCVFFSGLFVWHFGLILLLSFITHTYLVFSEMTFFFVTCGLLSLGGQWLWSLVLGRLAWGLCICVCRKQISNTNKLLIYLPQWSRKKASRFRFINYRTRWAELVFPSHS